MNAPLILLGRVAKNMVTHSRSTVSEEQEQAGLRRLDNTYKSPFPDAKPNTSNNSNKYIPEFKDKETIQPKKEKIVQNCVPAPVVPIYNKPIETYTRNEPTKWEPQRTFLPSDNLYIQRLDNFAKTGSNLPIGPSWLR